LPSVSLDAERRNGDTVKDDPIQQELRLKKSTVGQSWQAIMSKYRKPGGELFAKTSSFLRNHAPSKVVGAAIAKAVARLHCCARWNLSMDLHEALADLANTITQKRLRVFSGHGELDSW
jgi:hypothetical protein